MRTAYALARISIHTFMWNVKFNVEFVACHGLVCNSIPNYLSFFPWALKPPKAACLQLLHVKYAYYAHYPRNAWSFDFTIPHKDVAFSIWMCLRDRIIHGIRLVVSLMEEMGTVGELPALSDHSEDKSGTIHISGLGWLLVLTRNLNLMLYLFSSFLILQTFPHLNVAVCFQFCQV